MPRQEIPLERDGSALVEFAADLRTLREEAGRPPYRDLARVAHYSSTTLSDAAGGKKVPSLAVTLAFVKACGGDEKEWERRWHSLAAAARTPEPEPDCGEAPYLGLAAYGSGDADRFFGREQLVADLERRVARQRFVAVFGPSGSGKSSVLRAGLVPRLPGAVVLFTPGAHPLEECAVHLARRLNLAAPAVRDQLAQRPDALALLAKQADLVLVVDQFEEIFTLCQDPEERERFLTALLAAARTSHVVIGVRADFYARCGSHAELVAVMQDAIVTVGPMTTDELRRAIVHPARLANCTVESTLLATLMTEAHGQVGMLPLLSHAMLETWRRRQGNALTLAAFQNAGGLHGALAQTADLVFDEFDDEQRDIAKALFLRLSALGDGTEDTKRRVDMSEIDDDPAVTAVLERLTCARLLTRTRDGVEITHEALIRSWPRLRDWLAHDRDGQRLHRELTEAAAAWERHGRDVGSLLRGVRLDVIADWVWDRDPVLNQSERLFVEESVANDEREFRHRRRTALRQRAFVLLQGAIAFAIVLIVGSTVLLAVPDPDHRREQIERARWAADEAVRLIPTDPELAAHIALAAFMLDRSPRARDALTAATAAATVAQVGPLDSTVTALPRSPFVDPRPDGNSVPGALVSRTADDSTSVVNSGVRLRGGAGASLSPAAHLAATVDHDQQVRIWNLTTERELSRLPGRFAESGFSHEGQLFATGDGRSTALWTITDPRAPALLTTVPGGRALFVPGQKLITVEGAAIRVWDLRNPRNPALDREFTDPKGEPSAIAHVTGRDYLVTGDRTGHLTMWDLLDRNRRPVSTEAHGGTVTAIAMSDRGRELASVGDDGRLVVWDVQASELKKTREFHTNALITRITFANNSLITVEHNNVMQWRLDPESAATVVCGAGSGNRTSSQRWQIYFEGQNALSSPCTGSSYLLPVPTREP